MIQPELEGGLEVVRHTLLNLGFPASQVQPYTDEVRRDHYDTSISTAREHQALDQLRNTVRGIDLAWRRLGPGSSLVGQTLTEANVRQRTGASVIAIIRAQQAMVNPKSDTRFEAGDLIGLMGDSVQIVAFDQLLVAPAHVGAHTEHQRDAGGVAALQRRGAPE